MTRDEMLERMSYEEFLDWRLLEAIEPWGDRLMAALAGIIVSTLANVNRDPKERPEPYTPKDFIGHLFIEEERKPQTAEQQLAMMKLMQKVQEIKKARRDGRRTDL